MHQLLIMCLNITITITITISQTTIMRISMVLVLKGSMTSARITRTAILKIDRAMLMTITRSLEEHHRISRITTFIPMPRSTLRCQSLMHMSSNNSIHTILQPWVCQHWIPQHSSPYQSQSTPCPTASTWANPKPGKTSIRIFKISTSHSQPSKPHNPSNHSKQAETVATQKEEQIKPQRKDKTPCTETKWRRTKKPLPMPISKSKTFTWEPAKSEPDLTESSGKRVLIRIWDIEISYKILILLY